MSMILAETAGVVAVGLGCGAGLAYAASRLIGSRLYGVEALDPLSAIAATMLLLLAALAATCLPALRAARLDPVRALRQS